MRSNNLIPIIVCVIFVVIFFVILDRFIMGSVQRRSGPYIVGWFGLSFRLKPINGSYGSIIMASRKREFAFMNRSPITSM